MRPDFTRFTRSKLRALLTTSAVAATLALPGLAQAQADPEYATDLAHRMDAQFADIGRDLVNKERQHPTPGGPRTPDTAPLPGSPVSAPDLYNFTYWVWKVLNQWLNSAPIDYPRQLDLVRPYLTPACLAQLSSQMWQQPVAPLPGFKRRLSLISGLYPLWVGKVDGIGDFPSYITPRAAPDVGWDVQLNVIAHDRQRGQEYNDQRWWSVPIHVVPYDADPKNNPWMLAVDCPSGPTVDIGLNPDTVKQAQQRWKYLAEKGKVPFKFRLNPFWD